MAPSPARPRKTPASGPTSNGAEHGSLPKPSKGGLAGAGRPRRGRPRAADAGQVEQRVLDAADDLFLAQGFDRTTMDQVCERAQASKTTVYGRYPTKGELFAAVVARQAERFSARVPASAVGDAQQRLITVGLALAEETLTVESIALMRATAAEAPTFPDVARQGFRVGFGHCVAAVARTLTTGPTGPALGAGSLLAGEDEVTALATRFVEMALHPLYMHAFFGADLSALRQRAREDIPHVASLLLAAPVAERPGVFVRSTDPTTPATPPAGDQP